MGETTPKPSEQELVTLTKREHIELVLQARSHRPLLARAVARIEFVERRHQAEKARFAQREAELKAALEAAQAPIRDLRLRVFGAKTEQSRSGGAVRQVSAGRPRPAWAARPRSHARRRCQPVSRRCRCKRNVRAAISG